MFCLKLLLFCFSILKGFQSKKDFAVKDSDTRLFEFGNLTDTTLSTGIQKAETTFLKNNLVKLLLLFVECYRFSSCPEPLVFDETVKKKVIYKC